MCGNVDDNRKVWLSGVMNYIQLGNWIWVVAQAVARSLSLSPSLALCLSASWLLSQKSLNSTTEQRKMPIFMRFYTHLDQFSTTGLDICVFFLLVASFLSLFTFLFSWFLSPSLSQYVRCKVEKLQQKYTTTHCNNEMWKHTLTQMHTLHICTIVSLFFARCPIVSLPLRSWVLLFFTDEGATQMKLAIYTSFYQI